MRDLLIALARESLSDPRQAARRIMALNLPVPARWSALLLVSVLSSLFMHLGLRLGQAAPGAPDAPPFPMGPFWTVLLFWGSVMLTVGLVHHVGRWRGGRGRFEDALILMVWVQVMLLAVQVVQLAALILLPPLALLLGWIGLGLFGWLMVNFTAELHGFARLGPVLAGMVLTLLALSVVLAVALTLILAATGGVPNV